ncbi:hypothetical protein MTP99_015047 [Tenebrio molitor]|nr:hypothetical protein MTP99_015047 [Tenebrio molitor]
MKTTRRRVEDAMKENREDRILLGGNFNGRIGERGARKWKEEKGDGKRKSKDKVENAEGKRLMEWIEENGREVLKGNKQGDEEGEWTYIGSRREIVIHYETVNEEAWERVEEFRREREREGAESDHLEIAVEEAKGRERTKKERGGE